MRGSLVLATRSVRTYVLCSMAVTTACSAQTASAPSDSALPRLLAQSEVAQLFAKATVSFENENGGLRTLVDSTDGTLEFHAGAGHFGKHGHVEHAQGIWNVDDKGRYCIQIQEHSPWGFCKFVFFSNDGYYASDSSVFGPNAVRWEIKN